MPETDGALPWPGLIADGEPLSTVTSKLMPVRRHHGQPAMLKVVRDPDERKSGRMLAYYTGKGAVRLFEERGNMLLMERAVGSLSLTMMVAGDQDDEATAVICDVSAALHAPRPAPPQKLTGLEDRFGALFGAAAGSDLLSRAAQAARSLLSEPHDARVLHGDIHHENILHDTKRGWLAIDPKGLWGERTYDFANTLLNPMSLPDVVLAPGRLQRQANVIAARAKVPLRRLLSFTLVHSALAGCWFAEDGQDPTLPWSVAEIVSGELSRG